MEEASMRFLLSIFCQSFTQAGFYYLMSLYSPLYPFHPYPHPSPYVRSAERRALRAEDRTG